MTNQFTIRIAQDEDCDAIYSIWRDGISNSFEVKNEENMVLYKKRFRNNFDNRNSIFNFWVAVDDENNILGWQSLTRAFVHPFKTENFAESSTYISLLNRYKGVGKSLMTHAIEEAQKSPLEYIIGFVAVHNETALKLTDETGWQRIGVLPTSSKIKNQIEKYILIRTL